MITRGTIDLYPGFGTVVVIPSDNKKLLFLNLKFGEEMNPSCGPETHDYFKCTKRTTSFSIKYHIESGHRTLKYFYISQD